MHQEIQGINYLPWPLNWWWFFSAVILQIPSLHSFPVRWSKSVSESETQSGYIPWFCQRTCSAFVPVFSFSFPMQYSFLFFFMQLHTNTHFNSLPRMTSSPNHSLPRTVSLLLTVCPRSPLQRCYVWLGCKPILTLISTGAAPGDTLSLARSRRLTGAHIKPLFSSLVLFFSFFACRRWTCTHT